jgi:GT2 family glycosyltransferase
MNAVCRETAQLLRKAARDYGNVTLFPSRRNLFKCPMMHLMLHKQQLETEWMIWFDDDSHVTGPNWLMDLAMAMERSPEVELFGSLRGVDVSDHLEKFIESAAWYRKIPRQVRKDTGKPTIVFPVGGFWAVKSARLREISWPDPRLRHFEDDYLMGEALRQQGVKQAHFESGVRINDAARRAPWDAPTGLPLESPH